MTVSVIDAGFPIDKQHSGLGSSWLHWECARLGMPVVGPDDCDVILVTSQYPSDAGYIKSLKKRFHKPVVVGGCGGSSPYSLGLQADVVCVGDGQNMLRTLAQEGLDAAARLPEAWVHGESRSVEVAKGFPWQCPPIQGLNGAYSVWCGRGCRKKCFFCQTGWGMEYSENPDPKVMLSQIDSLVAAGERVTYLSNDALQHSFFELLPETHHGSYSIEYIRRRGLPPAKQVRLGIEGVSAKLRSFVGKAVSHDDLVNATVWLSRNGIAVRWFLMVGFPGETKADWEELKDAILRWKRLTTKGQLGLSFTAWVPMPATPMALLPCDNNHDENFKDFQRWYFEGKGRSGRLYLIKPQSHEARLKRASITMGLGPEQLKKGGDWGPNDRVNYPHKDVRNRVAASLSGRLKC